ncbi:MAG: hypothetical protein AUI01_02495 [Ktedonobacter sp. 13_2_20CM_2_56_8]|nr:MAG: hypothetical protein AUI01_02495 [Ktedonobacter sp. 13_2_20CM_2_56_8]
MSSEITPQERPQQHHALYDHAGPSAEKVPPSETREAARVKRRPLRWSARSLRDAWFLLVVLLLGLGTVLAFSNIGASLQQQATSTQPATLPTPVVSATPVSTAKVIVRAAQVRLYPFPQTNVGLMQPTVDAHGNVWVGEMFANHLAWLDSHTGVVTTWEPPNGKNGLMSTAIDAHGNIWFVEQGANYIGRFDPVQHIFRIFPLGTVNGRPLGPQDIQFDTMGRLWFTAPAGGRIGRFDPATGTIQTWAVPAPHTGIAPVPFSLTLTRDTQVWFGYITGGAVGHFDPATGHVTLYHLADTQAQIFSMAHDDRGRIWFSEIIPGRLGMVDSATGRVTGLPVPTVAGHPAALYGLIVAQNGDVWFVNNGANALVRYAPKNASYTFFQLAQASGGLYGLTLDATGTLWFTTSGSSTNAVGNMHP